MNAPRLRPGALLLLALGSASLVAFAVHCGSGGESTFTGTCERLYPGQCGTPCSSDDGCPSALHCSSGTCTVACAPNETCANGVVCSPRGRCGDDPSPTLPPDFAPDDSGPSDGGAEACADIDVQLAKVTPTVLFLIDRSSSMANDFGGQGSRWEVVKRTLLEPDGGVIKSLENDVAFGLATYASPGGVCPTVPVVPWQLGNYETIANFYGDAGTQSGTPTGESLLRAAGVTDAGIVDGGLAAAQTPGPKFIILATDGEPYGCGGASLADSRVFTVNAAGRVREAGVSTYVIAIGPEIAETHQRQVANAGLGFPVDAPDAAPIFRTNNQGELIEALSSIIRGVRECTFELNGAVQSGTAARGVVTLNGTPLTFNDGNGWRLNSPTELEFVGGACTTIKTAATVEVTARFPCGAVTPR